ncbi:syntaxin-1A-like [Oratosquilla oratoria]|uniref:syntaxin-1A-like n=1 Tax=Oratosquilla oratoria TaxID=337810 RepID=UPI003F7689B1
MIRDRLNEFRELRTKAGLKEEDFSVTIEESQPDLAPLLNLLDKIGPLYVKLKKLRVNVNDLRALLHEHGNRGNLEDKIADIKNEIRAVKKVMNEVKAEGESQAAVVGHVANTHHLALVLHLSDVLSTLSLLHADAHDRNVQYLRKELIITGQANMNEEELETLLDQPSAVFTQNIIKETQLARQQLQDLQERHEAVQKLEKSIAELAQLFQDLAVMVDQQGESVSRIETFVFEAQTKAANANQELIKARESKTKAMKKKICIISIVVVVLLIIILSLVFSM